MATGDPAACQCWGLQCRLPRLLLALRRRGWLHRQLAACAPILQVLPPPDVVDVLHLVWHNLHKPEAPWDAPSPFAASASTAAPPWAPSSSTTPLPGAPPPAAAAKGGTKEGGGGGEESREEKGEAGERGGGNEGAGVPGVVALALGEEEEPLLMNALGTKLFLILRKHVADLGPLLVDMCFPT